MVYVKPDGTGGFSWKKHHDFLLREDSDNLESIAHARFEMLAEEQPDKAAQFRAWDEGLRAKIDAASDRDENFGFVGSNLATKEFVKENDLMTLFDDVPGLSSQIDDLDFSFLEEDKTARLLELTEENFDAWLNGITLD